MQKIKLLYTLGEEAVEQRRKKERIGKGVFAVSDTWQARRQKRRMLLIQFLYDRSCYSMI